MLIFSVSENQTSGEKVPKIDVSLALAKWSLSSAPHLGYCFTCTPVTLGECRGGSTPPRQSSGAVLLGSSRGCVLALPGGLLPPPTARKGRNKQQQWASRGSPCTPSSQSTDWLSGESCWGLCEVRGAGTPALEPPACPSSAPRAPPKPFHEQSGGRETRAVFEDAVDFQVSV